MIELTERRICDVCRKEVKDFAGKLTLEYTDVDTPLKVDYKEVCVDCCRKLHDAIIETVKEISNAQIDSDGR